MDAGPRASVHVDSFSGERRRDGPWLKGSLTVERETWAVCFSL